MINRKKIELIEKRKRERALKELEMKCDICQLSHFNEVFILRNNRFAKIVPRSISKTKTSRVCWECARWLFKNRYYNFGDSWRNLFFYQLHIKDKNREKYMVIHA
ncbi:hypothetical protein 15570_00028 [Lokiarchaeota virus WyrdV1]|nr:hypothetical protein 15570_00028 [Lokiarchaeota virus WyrdV1]